MPVNKDCFKKAKKHVCDYVARIMCQDEPWSLEEFEEHAKTCPVCQHYMGWARKTVRNAFENAMDMYDAMNEE